MHTANNGLPWGRYDGCDVIFISFGKTRHLHGRPSRKCWNLHLLWNLLRTLDCLIYGTTEELYTCGFAVGLMETTLSSLTVLDLDELEDKDTGHFVQPTVLFAMEGGEGNSVTRPFPEKPDEWRLSWYIYMIHSIVLKDYNNTHSCWPDALKCEIAGEKRFYT